MKKKIVWLIVSCLMVAALVLASCGPEPVVEEKKATVVTKEPEKKVEVVEPEKKEEEVVEEEPAVGEPQYGGTLTVWASDKQATDPPSPDIMDGMGNRRTWVEAVLEKPLIGDLETYGPRGTSECFFRMVAYIPWRFVKGSLIESWELTPEKIIWHVRPGIYWQGRDVMESRELVAQDIADDINVFRAAPAGGKFASILKGDVYAPDKYTVVAEFETFSSAYFYYVGYEDRAVISPPETAGSKDWADLVGTGPFMFEEYVVGSHMSYVRNPDYWDATTIDGVEYQMPFIDRLVFPIIPDVSTQIAALRTGKLDIHRNPPAAEWGTLDTQTPEMLKASFTGQGRGLQFRCDVPPFDIVEVRRAMMVGTDQAACRIFGRAGDQPIHHWPIHPANIDCYTPLEDLPAETQLLYDYNPELARQMLADAGYPDGLAVEFTAGPSAEDQDLASLLKDQWAKIGIELEITTVDETTLEMLHRSATYPMVHTAGSDIANPITTLLNYGMTGGSFQYSNWENESFNELCALIQAEMAEAEQMPFAEEAALIMIDEVPIMPLYLIPNRLYWWPWLKNYDGELTLHDGTLTSLFSYIWIDQDLKAEMGY